MGKSVIDATNIKQYSLTGKKDAFGSVVDYGTGRLEAHYGFVQ
jgi:hypothetical protein